MGRSADGIDRLGRNTAVGVLLFATSHYQHQSPDIAHQSVALVLYIQSGTQKADAVLEIICSYDNFILFRLFCAGLCGRNAAFGIKFACKVNCKHQIKQGIRRR